MCSDHCPIDLEIDFSKFQRGRGFWKFNNSLLKDPEYLTLINKVINRVTTQYAIVNNNPRFYFDTSFETVLQFMEDQTPETLQELELVINPELFLDTLLMEIRGATIKYAANKKRNRKAQEQLLLHDIEILEFQLQANTVNRDIVENELEIKKGGSNRAI